MFKLIIAPIALKNLKLISRKHHIESIKEIFEDIKQDPLVGKPLEDELKHKYTYHVSAYRIVYKIDWKDKTVSILKVGHRGVVYQK